jgi:hypothetical protein
VKLSAGIALFLISTPVLAEPSYSTIIEAIGNRMRDARSIQIQNMRRMNNGDWCGFVSAALSESGYADPVAFGVRVATLEVFVEPDLYAVAGADAIERDLNGLRDVCGELR